MKFGYWVAGCLYLAACSAPQNDQNTGAGEETVYQASDLTDSVFTSGIEGPAVDKDGNLYVVNYLRQGTIGVIHPDGKRNSSLRCRTAALVTVSGSTSKAPYLLRTIPAIISWPLTLFLKRFLCSHTMTK